MNLLCALHRLIRLISQQRTWRYWAVKKLVTNSRYRHHSEHGHENLSKFDFYGRELKLPAAESWVEHMIPSFFAVGLGAGRSVSDFEPLLQVRTAASTPEEIDTESLSSGESCRRGRGRLWQGLFSAAVEKPPSLGDINEISKFVSKVEIISEKRRWFLLFARKHRQIKD